MKDTELIGFFIISASLKDSSYKIHRPSLFNVYQLKNIPFNLIQGTIRVENRASTWTGLFESIACIPNYRIYLVHRMAPSPVNMCFVHYNELLFTSSYCVSWNIDSQPLLWCWLCWIWHSQCQKMKSFCTLTARGQVEMKSPFKSSDHTFRHIEMLFGFSVSSLEKPILENFKKLKCKKHLNLQQF